jgi:hypothetical protein
MSEDIWSDPMCGCPEDFTEEWGRKISRLYQESRRLGA